MDDRNGYIYKDSDLKKLTDTELAALKPHLKLMEVAPTERQQRRVPPRVGRNEPCPCGSGKKFKKCCLVRHPAE